MQVSTLKTGKYSDSSDSKFIQSSFPRDSPTRGYVCKNIEINKDC